jgi:hypothetical protein
MKNTLNIKSDFNVKKTAVIFSGLLVLLGYRLIDSDGRYRTFRK